MKRKLAAIARELSEDDLQELLRLKRTDGKLVAELSRKRDKLAEELAKADAELARLTGGAAPAKRRGRRKAAEKSAEAEAPEMKQRAKPGPKPGSKRMAKRGGRRKVNFTAAVRDVFAKAGTPLRAAEVVGLLSDSGMKIKDPADLKKRVSVVLASQKNSFEQVERGLYKLKD